MNISSKSPLEQLEAKAAQWNVTLDETRETPTSLLGFGVREDRGVVLKITKYEGDESDSGRILQAFAGDGVVRVYEFETGAVLLERLEPGEQLVNLVKHGKDEEATQILAQVIQKLRGHQAPAGCPTVADWGRGFDRYLQSDNHDISRELVHEAHSLYQQLTNSQGATMLLHGDLQHYNVLFDEDRGWVAIDPKGIVGELEYEIGALLRNPVELPELFTKPVTIDRRLEILTSALHLDETRIRSWSFAQAVLSAIWNIEDGYRIESNSPTLLIAHILRQVTRDTARY